MGLLGLPSGVKFVVTGLVLLAAVLVDSSVEARAHLQRHRIGVLPWFSLSGGEPGGRGEIAATAPPAQRGWVRGS